MAPYGLASKAKGERGMPRMKERFARLALVIGFGMSAVSAGAQDYSSLLQEATVTEGRLFQVSPDAQASWAVPVTVRVPVFGDNTPPQIWRFAG